MDRGLPCIHASCSTPLRLHHALRGNMADGHNVTYENPLQHNARQAGLAYRQLCRTKSEVLQSRRPSMRQRAAHLGQSLFYSPYVVL